MSPRDLERRRPTLFLAVVLLFAAVIVQAPVWYQEVYHPLKYQASIASAAKRYGLDPYLVAAVINTESGFDSRGVSRKGAVGLMQLLPTTAEEARRTSALKPPAHVEALKDPDVNIELGTRYLGTLMHRYRRTEWALAAYNAGARNADRWRKIAAEDKPIESIGYPVTKRYVATVMKQREEYRKLYPEAFAAASVAQEESSTDAP